MVVLATNNTLLFFFLTFFGFFGFFQESNPDHGMSWISGAKLEESCGKLSEARTIIRQACNACPNDEEVWLEALRLHPPNDGRAIAAQALRRLPKSVKLWLHAR